MRGEHSDGGAMTRDALPSGAVARGGVQARGRQCRRLNHKWRFDGGA